MDVQRLGAAIRGPGIDTRCWVSLAVAQADSVVEAVEPPKGGVFVDVQLFPTGEAATARVPSIYAGNGFGFYSKISKDDELVVLIPSGLIAEGVSVISRTWDAVDAPPQQAIDDPEEVMLVIEPEKNLRIAISSGGAARVTVGEDNTVHISEEIIELGAEGAGDKAVLESKNQTELKKLRNDVDALKNTYNAHSVTVNVPALGLIAPAGGGPVTGAAVGTSVAPADAAAIQTIDPTNSERVTIDK